MKKTIIATIVAVSAFGLVACNEAEAQEGSSINLDVTKFVGAEYEFEAENTTAFVGASVSKGGFEVTAKVDVDVDSADRGDISNINLDGSYAVTDSLSVYTENDFTDGLDHSETMVGVQYTF